MLQAASSHIYGLCRGWAGLTLILAVALTSSPLFGETVTPNDIARLRTVVSSSVSPNGEHIAYVVNRQRKPLEDEDGAAWRELYLLSPEGSSRPFVFGKRRVSRVSWTPDGKEITFLAKRDDDESASLYAIPVDGGEARRVFGHDTAINDYSFSPDGRRLAFLAKKKTEKSLEELRKKGFKQEIFEEDVEPVRVWVVALGEEDSEPTLLETPGSASILQWAPKGDRLVVGLQPLNLVDQSYTERKLHVFDVASGEMVTRFENPGKLATVLWSPDGERIAMRSAEDAHDPSAGRLAVVAAAGGPLKYLLPVGFKGDVVDFAWQNSSSLLAIVAEGTERSVYEISLDGTMRRRVGPGQGCWSSLELARDGETLALLGDTPSHPAELFRGTLAGGVEKATRSNPWFEGRALARQEVVRYQARDGETIEGIFTYPLMAPKGQRHPLIVHAHGGPESHFCNGWMTSYNSPGQIAAARGFAVFAPNYRGSTGRGVAFAKEHQGDPAGKEFNDIIDGIDALVERGLVDGDKVGIVGGSYGGFAAAWGATYFSERYAAAVMFVGISNHISKSGTTDIPEEIYYVHQRKRIWEDWQLFLERSPIYHVEKSRTATLILGGTEDTRVHPGQSLELYRALKTLGKAPVRYVRYPGEKHGNTKAAARYDYSLRMLRWFEHYLQGRDKELPDAEIDYAAALGIEDEEAEE